MEDISTKAYGQWVVIDITNTSTTTVVVRNIRVMWGKLHWNGDKDHEVPVDDIENTKIRSGEEFRINSCGRKDSPSGTEGEFDIYENGGEKVGHFYWSCPWGDSGNIWRITGQHNSKWVIKTGGANPKRGALGYISVIVSKKGTNLG